MPNKPVPDSEKSLMFSYAAFPKGKIIPYYGVLFLQDINAMGPSVPQMLMPGVETGWNRIVQLGHRPVVTEKGTLVSQMTTRNINCFRNH
jgi:hypothetical protein